MRSQGQIHSFPPIQAALTLTPTEIETVRQEFFKDKAFLTTHNAVVVDGMHRKEACTQIYNLKSAVTYRYRFWK